MIAASKALLEDAGKFKFMKTCAKTHNLNIEVLQVLKIRVCK